MASHEVTLLLNRIDSGDGRAASELLPLVYDELRRLAAAAMAHERPGQTWQATALVHEAYLRLAGGPGVTWNNRAHFFRTAAMAMRRLLIDRARERGAQKRGGDRRRDAFDAIDLAAIVRDCPGIDLETLDHAVEELAALSERAGDIIRFRWYAGMSYEQIGAALQLPETAVKSEVTFAVSWLRRRLGVDPGRQKRADKGPTESAA